MTGIDSEVSGCHLPLVSSRACGAQSMERRTRRSLQSAFGVPVQTFPYFLPERKKLAQFFLFLVLTRSHFLLVFVSDCALEDFSQ